VSLKGFLKRQNYGEFSIREFLKGEKRLRKSNKLKISF
jgi:hypothetical protein